MAMQNVFNILVDLKVAKTIPQPLVTQNDSVVFILEVMENGVPFDLTDTTIISLAHTRKDQTVVVTPGTKVGNKATFALGTNETSVTGAVTAKAQFYDADGRVSTLSFSYQVGLDPTGADYVPSASEATLIEVVLNDGPLIIASAEEAAAYANEQGDYALQVGTDNETRYLNAVSTVALRDSTYPTPSHGDTVRVTGTSTSYRYVLGTGWVITDVYNPTAIDNLNQQLAEKADEVESVRLIKNRGQHPVIERIFKKPQVMAHRGFPNLFPENTIEAFYACVNLGVEFFETDIRKTIDGEFVVIHDATTGRTCGTDLVVADSTLAQLKALDQTLTNNASFYGNPKIPTIDELFEFIRKTNCVVNVNFDYGIAVEDRPLIIEKIYAYGIQNNVILQKTFFADDLGICIVELVELTDLGFEAAGKKGNIIAGYGYASTRNVVGTKAAMLLGSKYNVPINVYTATDPTYDTFHALDATGVNIIMMDRYWQRGGKTQ